LRAAAVLSAALAGALCVAPVAAANWSAPARLSGCAAALSAHTAPLVVFPSSSPQRRSGPGALLWEAPRRCGASSGGGAPSATTGGSGGAEGTGGTAGPVGATAGGGATAATAASGGEAFGATLSAQDVPDGGQALEGGPGGLVGVAAATGTAAGQILAFGSDAGGGAFAEGRAAGAFSATRPLGGPAAPVSAFSGYLGDTVAVSTVRIPRAGWALAVRVQRHYSDTPAPPRLLRVGSTPPSAVAATLDYRSDILVVWARGGGVYAREITQAGIVEAVHRLGSLGPGPVLGAPELWALLSDDGHAIITWRSQSLSSARGGRSAAQFHRTAQTRAGQSRAARPRPDAAAQSYSAAQPRAGAQLTRIELSIPGPGLAFREPRLVESYADPSSFVPPAGSLRLIRLSSEAVMMAWTGVAAGRYVVRASPVSLHRGAWAPVTISGAVSSPPADALLADLAAGPHAEALALWTVAPRLANGAAEPQLAIFAARGHYAGHGEADFEAPEVVAPAARNGPPAVAFDPGTGRALAAWVAFAGAPHVEYALRAPTPIALPASAIPARTIPPIPADALACCLGLALPYASIESSAIRIGTPLAACLK
jgi:hypothetical protein